jgi:6-phosphogluconolactonase
MNKKLIFKNLMLATASLVVTTNAYCGTYVYISNIEDADISAYELSTGPNPHLNSVGRFPAGKFVMPMAVTPDGKNLYASVRSKPYSLYMYQIDQLNGQLKWTGAVPLADSMVYVSTDKTGKWLLATSFGGHNNSVNKIEANGYVNPVPAEAFPSGGKNPHSIVFDQSNKFVYVPQLGTDEIKIHTFNSSQAKPLSESASSVALQKQQGPRHIVISDDNKFAYVITEMTGEVIVFSRDIKSGALTQIQSASSLPSDNKLVPGRPRPPTGSPEATAFDDSNMIFCAEIKLTPNGKFLYTSERTKSTLSGFEVNPQTGKVKYLFTIPTEEMPRGFNVDPSGQFLVATGQKSDKVSLYSINQSTGELNLIERVQGGKGANWVTFVKTK